MQAPACGSLSDWGTLANPRPRILFHPEARYTVRQIQRPGETSMWPIRSALFVPAHRREWVGKAIRVSPGAAVLDIEDSVPPEFKAQAMANLKDEIAELKASNVGAFVRINPLHERTGEEIEAAMAEGLTAIVPP